MTDRAADLEMRAAAEPKSGRLAIGSWMLFDWAAQPFYTLITTFIFAPYFTAHFIGDPVRGPAIWGYTMAAASLIIAFGGPVLGAFADARGRLKPMIALLSTGFIAGQVLLWYAVPGGGDGGTFWLIIAALIVATIAGEFSAILNNSLMPRLAGPDHFGRISGGGWAMGYAGGLVSLILFLLFFQLTNEGGDLLLGVEPPLPIGSDEREADRVVGPAAAIWFAIFVVPFFLFTPDAPSAAGQRRVSATGAFSAILSTVREIRRYRDLAWFFFARMLFIDGLLAIFAFGGIYATSLFGWTTQQLGIFGIILSVAAGIGAAIGGFLDDRFGSKTVVTGALFVLIVGALGIISIDRTHIFFVVETGGAEEAAGIFSTVNEQLYLAFALLIGLASGPLQSASRSLLVRMAPREQISEFFGFFAFSGKVTAFAAPLLIGLAADLSGSLQLAMSIILLFLASGLVAMRMIDEKR